MTASWTLAMFYILIWIVATGLCSLHENLSNSILKICPSYCIYAVFQFLNVFLLTFTPNVGLEFMTSRSSHMLHQLSQPGTPISIFKIYPPKFQPYTEPEKETKRNNLNSPAVLSDYTPSPVRVCPQTANANNKPGIITAFWQNPQIECQVIRGFLYQLRKRKNTVEAAKEECRDDFVYIIKK